MRDFFKPWRRRIGVVMLGLACVFAAGWVRSHFRQDDVAMELRNGSYGITTMVGGLDFYRTTTPDDSQGFGWPVMHFHSTIKASNGRRKEFLELLPDHEIEWRRTWGGFQFGVSHEGARRDEDIELPYWAITIPLTLLSAWLLLRKPRQTAPRQTTEPAPTTGGSDA